MSKIKENKGITLVALVITVIVLIILAGVTISLVLGDNGIITKSKEAKQNITNASSEEKESMQNILNEVNDIESGIGEIVTPPEELDPRDPNNWDKEKVIDIVTEGERSAPIPKGYVASKADTEKTITGGLVIYEGTEEVTNQNVAQAQTTRNQYVWIPVDEINDMVMCKSKTTDTQCNIVRQSDGSFKCKTHNSEDLAGKMYTSKLTEGDTGIPHTYIKDFNQKDQSYTKNSGTREPDLIIGSNGNEYDASNNNYHGLETANIFLKQMNDDFIEMVKSVYTYGGFYLGRYEIGEGGTSKKGQTVLTADSSSGNMWYGLYKTIRHKAEGEEVVNKDMIWRKPV